MKNQRWGLLLGLLWAGMASAQTLMLSVPGSGRVAEVAVNPGQQVRAGALLIQLDARAANALLAQRQAERDALREEQAEAQRELDRAEELFERTVLSVTDLQLARSAFAKVDAQYRAAEAAALRAEAELEDLRIHAPADGVVKSVLVAPGQVVVNRCQVTPMLEFDLR
jgi:RND family efflux transporter MFP subunit